MKSTGTHIPLTIAACSLCPSLPILELGMGHYSTPILNVYARLGRKVVSYDTHEDWIKVFMPLAHPNHQMLMVRDGWQNERLEQKWGAALVDLEPMAARVPAINRLANWAQVLVLHDTQDPGYCYDAIWHLFKYRVDYTFWPTTTALVSNTLDVRRLNFGNVVDR